MRIPLPVCARVAICNLFGRSRQDYSSGGKGKIYSHPEWLESLEEREGEECFVSASRGYGNNVDLNWVCNHTDGVGFRVSSQALCRACLGEKLRDPDAQSDREADDDSSDDGASDVTENDSSGDELDERADTTPVTAKVKRLADMKVAANDLDSAAAVAAEAATAAEKRA